MTTVERHMMGLAIITLANVSAAFAALKTFEARLWAEAQKAHIEAPQKQQRSPYESPMEYRMAHHGACCDTDVAYVLTLDRVKILSE